VTRATADAEDEKAAAALANSGETARHGVELLGLDRSGQCGGARQVCLRVPARRH
jgi:hypothetical protein